MKLPVAIECREHHDRSEGPLCALPPARIVHRSEHAVVIRGAFPLTRGHSLVLPRRHVGSLFALERAECEALFDRLDEARRALDAELAPAGHNVGINDGPAAGQTVPHLACT